MGELLAGIKERIAQLKGQRPIYREMVDFYELVLEEQEAAQRHLKIPSVDLDAEPLKLRREQGRPVLERGDFDIDLETAKKLFYAISAIGKGATLKMAQENAKIEEMAASGRLDLENLLRRHYDERYLGREAERLGLDKGILCYLISASLRPLMKAQMEQLCSVVDLEAWLRRNCPICGSAPSMAELRDEGGKRYLQCSFCACQWRLERVACPYCGNREAESLHYLVSENEGEDAYRIDVCDQCNSYIKTVDARKLDYEPDLDLEDIVTVHLDLLALKKGYKRPTPLPLGTMAGGG